MVCTVDIINDDWGRDVDLGIRFQNSGDSVVDQGMPHDKNDWGMAAKVSGCGDNYGVYLWEHNHGGDWRTETTVAQNHHVMQDGRWWLHHLYGRTSRVTIVPIPLNDNSKMVGFQDAHWLSDYSIKDNVSRIWHHGYEIRPGEWVEQNDLCPGGGRDNRYPVAMHNEFGGHNDIRHRYACVYPKSEGQLNRVYNGTKGTNREPMYEDLVNRLCAKKDNLGFKLPNGDLCAHHEVGRNLAVEFCKEGTNFTAKTKVCSPTGLSSVGGQATYNELLKWWCGKDANIKDARCDGLSVTDRENLSDAYCERAPNDTWCQCYNVSENKCPDDKKTGVAGCAETAAYVDIRNKTPSEYKNQWDGQRKCGSVCSGTGKYVPSNVMNGCKTTIQICAQNINVKTATDSEISAKCSLQAADGSKTGTGDGGGGGGGGGGGEEETLIIPKNLADFKTFIPTGIEGLKTSKRQQAGVGVVGTGLMMMCCILLLLVVSSGGGPRRFRR